MAEYINREELLKDIEDSVRFSARNGVSAELRGAHKIVDRIKSAPTVDVVEVVRCKDCVNFKSTSNPKYCNKHIDDWGNGEIYTDEDDYCSYGERKSDDVRDK